MESIYNDVIKGRFIRPFLFGSRKNILSVEANIDEKEGCIYLHFDVELQNDYRPGYPIPKRSIYYAAREISEQLGILTEITDYSSVEKVYCIWICNNKKMPKKLQNTVSEYYIAKRERFNDIKVNGNEADNIEKAALMIFLNKTCFNGLYRVNRKGLFNVPMGAYKNPLICDEKKLRAVSEKLQNVKIVCEDYKKSDDFIDENTFVYFDPPYRPLTETSNFTAYTENLFDDEKQIELANFVERISNKGAMVVVSNSDPKNTNKEDEFFDKIYAIHKIKRVEATRMINCNSDARGRIKELLISNF